jgi:hypothetical protein
MIGETYRLEALVVKIRRVHGEVTLSPGELLMLVRELDTCWQRIGELDDAVSQLEEER